MDDGQMDAGEMDDNGEDNRGRGEGDEDGDEDEDDVADREERLR